VRLVAAASLLLAGITVAVSVSAGASAPADVWLPGASGSITSPPSPCVDGSLLDPVCALLVELARPPAAPLHQPSSLSSPPACGAAPAPPVAAGVSAAAETAPAPADTAASPSLAELLDILLHPLSTESPGLAHFTPQVASAVDPGVAEGRARVSWPPLWAGAATAASRIPSPLVTLVVCLCALFLLLHLALSLLDRSRQLPRHMPGSVARTRTPPLRLMAAAALLTPLSVSFAGSAPLHRLPRASISDAVTPRIQVTAPPSDRTMVPVTTSGPAIWQRLVGIESDLARVHARLAADEGRLAHFTASLGAPALAELVRSHRAAAAAYDRGLEAEYDLYREAAGDPGRARELLDTAATGGDAVAMTAVQHDLAVLQTRRGQELAIAAALAALSSRARLASEQVDAMRDGRHFIAPEIAPVSQLFGPTDLGIEPPLTYDGVFHRHFHTGIDIAAAEGTPLHAAAEGVVVLAASSLDGVGRLVGYGRYVVIAHAGGFLTLYGHLDRIAVRAGDPVHQGQLIGLEGSTGWSTGPHVHLEIRLGDRLLDPLPFLAGQLATPTAGERSVRLTGG